MRLIFQSRLAGLGVLAVVMSLHGLFAGPRSYGQQGAKPGPVTDATQGETVLDRVIAVVNNQVILASDLDLEMRIAQLLPVGDGRESTPEQSLERLTTRALIEQQVVQEDPHGMEIAPKDLEDSLAELRQNLPGCKRQDCSSPAVWTAYLATLDLTPERVSAYWSNRMAVLRFIERRFRTGIRISPEDIQKYYRETLVPRYAQLGDAPRLESIAPRIQEILLQQQVNALLNDWLKSLQDQGQVEILDATLRPPGGSSQVFGAPALEEPHTQGSAASPRRQGERRKLASPGLASAAGSGGEL